MDEVLRTLPPEAVILDIGSGRGSFDAKGTSFTVVRSDLESQPPPLPTLFRPTPQGCRSPIDFLT
jgi:hypothetical protein